MSEEQHVNPGVVLDHIFGLFREARAMQTAPRAPLTPADRVRLQDWLDEPVEWAEGHLELPQRPGLGRELSAAVLAQPRTTIE